MKIDKAIERLSNIGPNRATLSQDDLKAINLGGEALKQLQSCRLCCEFANSGLLSGETRD